MRIHEIDKLAFEHVLSELSEDEALAIGSYVGQLEKENERIKEVLEFYANRINYMKFIELGSSNITHDNGEKARKALEET